MTEQQFIDALVGFPSRQTDLRLRPDPYHLRQLAEHVRSAFSAPHLDQGFAGRLRRAIFDGLGRLDILPRDDPFWHGTNRRPTEGKLRDFVLKRGAGEEWSCWAYAATSLLWCSNDFGLPGWRGLYQLGLMDAAWPVHAAFHVWASSGYDTAPDLVRFLNEVGACVSARNALESIEARSDEGLASWARATARSLLW